MKNKIISLLISLLLLTALSSCQSDRQLMPPTQDARITIDIVFKKSTTKSSLADLHSQNTLSVMAIDEVAVAAIDLNLMPVTKAIILRDESEEGELKVPANQLIRIVAFATETDPQNIKFWEGGSDFVEFQAGQDTLLILELSEMNLKTHTLSIARDGGTNASSTFGDPDDPRFAKEKAIDGDFTTSWFSEGDSDPNGDFSTFTWTATEEVLIAATGIANNSMHQDTLYHTGFGYLGQVTFRIFSANEQMVFEGMVAYPTAKAVKMVFPLVRGKKIELILNQHANPMCGGFSELVVLGL